MSHIVIHRDHSLTLDQAREAAETIALQLADRYEVSHYWQDDSLYFERVGVSGQIDLE
ncbi:MAG TPA: poly(3-hydroxybutyrate) depolymerase, partial [Gammaproteobacteria bacterium]|nr:poly(3-hydroxybutyrate) depolymerase [Gammaproteobacteria bacterium]